MSAFRELAQAILLVVIVDDYPVHLGKLRDVAWMDAWKLMLSPDEWDSSGMFSPVTEPSDFRTVHQETRRFYKTKVPALT